MKLKTPQQTKEAAEKTEAPSVCVDASAVGLLSVCPTNQEWFLGGVPVQDVFERSGDAEFILDGDFEEDEDVCVAELSWRECDVPVGLIPALAQTMDKHLMMIVEKDHGRTSIAEENDRCARIRAWVESVGGIENALGQSPLLITMRGGQIQIEDGYHRLGVAVFLFGATTVRAICAEMP